MHGILFKQLKNYVTEEYGEDAWEAAMDEAGIEPKLYLPVTEYPDEEALALLEGITTVTGADETELLADFGRAMAPALLDTFEAHVVDSWSTMELLSAVDNEVFEVFYSEDGDPEEVTAERVDEDTVAVEYGSPLELCPLVRGVYEGLGESRGVDVEVTESACMANGADCCEMEVHRA